MLEFRKAKIEDKKEIERLLIQSGRHSLEYNFTTIFLWQEQYENEFAIEDDMLFMRSGRKQKSYLFPCGFGNIDAALDKLKDVPLNFHSLNKNQVEYLEKYYPDRFVFKENRDSEDYVYTAESLMNLTGKKLSSKRNHINKFILENPDWIYEKINTENLNEVRKMHENWYKLSDVYGRPGLLEETDAVKRAFDYFEELELEGGLIRAKGEVVAFSIGDRLNDKTFLVHIEKAYSSINGAYQIINREFVRNNCQEYEFINREDDTGDEGLRKAKLSYRPIQLVEKFSAKEIEK